MGWNTPSTEHEPERHSGPRPRAPAAIGTVADRDALPAPVRGPGPRTPTITGEDRATTGRRLSVSRVASISVADPDELDEGAQHGDRDVLLELRSPPERDRDGHRDQRERRGDLAQRDRDGAHADVPPSSSIRIVRSATRSPARVVGHEDERNAGERRGGPPPPRLRPRLERAVGSSRRGTSGSSARAGASITRCCSPTDRREASRSMKLRVEAGQPQREVRDRPPRPLGAADREADVLGHAAGHGSRELRDEARRAAAAPADRARGRPSPR